MFLFRGNRLFYLRKFLGKKNLQVFFEVAVFSFVNQILDFFLFRNQRIESSTKKAETNFIEDSAFLPFLESYFLAISNFWGEKILLSKTE